MASLQSPRLVIGQTAPGPVHAAVPQCPQDAPGRPRTAFRAPIRVLAYVWPDRGATGLVARFSTGQA